MRQVPHACIATLPRIAPPVLQRRFAHSIWGRTIWHDDLHAVRACFGSPLPAASAHPSGRLHILTPRGTEPRPLSELVPAIERGAGDILEGDGGWVAGVSCTEIGVAGPVVAWCTFMRAGTVLDAEAQEHFVTTATPSDIDANAHGSLVRLAASSDSIQHGVEVVWPTEIRRMLENGKEGEKGMRREVLTRAVRRAGLSMMRRNVTTNRLFVDGGTFATESARGKVFCGIPYAPAEGPGVRTCIVLARAMCRYFDSYILQGLHSRYPSYDFASLLHNRNALTREHLRGICILGCVPDVHNVLHRAFVKHRGTHFDGFHPSSEPRPLSLEETARVASALTPVSVKGQCDERGSGVPEQAEAQVNFEAVFAQRAAQAPSSDIVSTAVAPAASDLPRQEVSQLPREEVKARRGGPPAAGPSLPKLSSAISALLDSVAPDGVTEAKRPSPTVPTSSAELELNAPVSGADGGDARTVSHGVLRGADAVVQTISEQKRLLRRRRQQQPVPRADKGDEGTNALDAIMGVDQPSSSRLGTDRTVSSAPAAPVAASAAAAVAAPAAATSGATPEWNTTPRGESPRASPAETNQEGNKFECSACHKMLPYSRFSGYQRYHELSHTRRCRRCVADLQRGKADDERRFKEAGVSAFNKTLIQLGGEGSGRQSQQQRGHPPLTVQSTARPAGG